MDFNENKPIYLQIADKIMEKILNHTYKEGDRLPSVREAAADAGEAVKTAAHEAKETAKDVAEKAAGKKDEK